MMRVCLTPGCPNRIPILPGRKTPSRCAQCRGRSWSRPPPANLYAYGSGWQAVRKRVLERDGYQCQLRYADICVGRASQVDHIVQPEAGGTNDLANLRAVCRRCHARRTGQQGALAKQRAIAKRHAQQRKPLPRGGSG
jgi:5-methylcytosine-specific restriction protein A